MKKIIITIFFYFFLIINCFSNEYIFKKLVDLDSPWGSSFISNEELIITEKTFVELKKDKFLNVGISWSGNPNYPRDNFRSISFDKIEKFLLENKDINFYKLSRDIKKNNFIDYETFPNLIDLSEKNLFEIATTLGQFDLVVSSDTSIIHLAGILNIQSFLLLNYNSDWRWFLEKKETIWYPSVTVIKQNKLNSWDNVFIELNKILKSKKKRQRI